VEETAIRGLYYGTEIEPNPYPTTNLYESTCDDIFVKNARVGNMLPSILAALGVRSLDQMLEFGPQNVNSLILLLTVYKPELM